MIKVLQICPYEPPASGWVNRIKLLRRVIEERGGVCEVLDIGPNRRLERRGCVPVFGGGDYLRKVRRFAADGYTVHSHINGEYCRGMLLALAALTLFRLHGRRCVTTFHAGTDQPYFKGWRRPLLSPLYRLIFLLSHAVVCNSDAVRTMLRPLAGSAKVVAIPAFSRQYLSYRPTAPEPALDAFCERSEPLLSTYLCFRDGFFTDVLLAALPALAAAWPRFGLVIVGTGDEQPAFRQTLRERGLERHVMLAGDLPHDPFLTLIARSTVHLRTPVTDGVSSTVLEALHLRVPVVAADNGSRPPGVIVYRADDADAMAAALIATAADRDRIAAALNPPPVADTAAVEVDLLAGAATAAAAAENV